MVFLRNRLRFFQTASGGSEKKRNSIFIPAVRSFNKIMKVDIDKSQLATTFLVLNFEQN